MANIESGNIISLVNLVTYLDTIKKQRSIDNLEKRKKTTVYYPNTLIEFENLLVKFLKNWKLKKSYKNTIFDTFKNGIAQIILVPLVLLTLPILTKNLSVEEYGLWGLVFTTCSLTMPLTSLGLGTAMSRFISSAKNKK